MCGIVGILGPDIDAAALERVNNLLRHRGPDDASLYLGEGIGLAARRLSIIDLKSGRQPLSNEDGDVWVTYNGEIANAPELRLELEAAGHRFKTQADTEVIVHGYEQWGEKVVAHLRGMFAFGLWDAVRRRLLLARDRFGIKPLYYAQHGDRFAFASGARAVLAALPDMPRQANLESIWRLVEVGFLPNTMSAFKGVHKLPPAHLIVVEDRHTQMREYWRLEIPPDQARAPVNPEQAREAFIARLIDAVQAWRLSDVPVCSLLSGGIDSSSLAALLSEVSGAPIDTFTLGFPGYSHDETLQARQTAAFIQSRSHELRFTERNFDDMVEVVRHSEEPRGATSATHYALFKACHQAGFKVVMVGEGADELLGGYPWYQLDRRVRRLLRLPAGLRNFLADVPLLPLQGVRRALRQGAADDPITRYIRFQQWGMPQCQKTLLNIDPPTPLEKVWFDKYGERLKNLHPFDQFSLIDRQTRMVEFINFSVDRMSMAHSVEARPPFLDHLLWEFCAQLPVSLKLTAQGNKQILRLGMQGRLPQAAIQRPKLGLSAPHNEWWQLDKHPSWVEDLTSDSALTEAGYFVPEEFKRLRAWHRSGRSKYGRLLNVILSTQIWHYEVLNGA